MTDETRQHEVVKPRRLRRLVFGSLLGLWLLTLAAIGIGFLSILYGWQVDRFRGVLEAALGDLLDQEIRIGRLEGGLLDGITLHDVSIAPQAPGAAPDDRLVAHQIALRLDVRSSLRESALVVTDVVLVQPTLTLSRIDEGRFRLAGWGDLGSGDSDRARVGLPFEIVLASGQANDVHLALTHDSRSGLADVAGRLDVAITDFRFGGQPGLEWPDATRIQFDLARAHLGDRDLGGGRLVAQTRFRHATIEVLELDGPLGGLAITGELDLDPRLDRLSLRSGRLAASLRELELDAWRVTQRDVSSTGQPEIGPLSGQLDLEILRSDTSDHEADYEFDLHAVTAPLRIFGGEIERIEANAVVALAGRRWSLEESSVDLAAGRILVSGRGAGRIAEQFDVRARELDLARLPGSWLPPVRLAGHADLDLSIHGAFDDPIGMLELDARTLTVDGIGPGTLDFALRADGERRYVLEGFDWTFESGTGRYVGTWVRSIGTAAIELGPGRVAVRELALDWTGGSMRVDGGLADGVLQPSHIELDSLDLAVVARMLGLEGRPEGVVSGRFDVAGASRDPDVAAQLLWSAPRYRGLGAERIEIDVSTKSGQRSIEAVLKDSGREPLRALARAPRLFGIDDPRSWLSDPRFGLDLQVDDLDLVWLAPWLALHDLAPVGRLEGRLTASGGTDGPTAIGDLRLDAVRFDRLPGDDPDELPTRLLGPVTGRVVFEGSQLRTEGLRYGSGVDELLFDATLGWAGRRADDLDLAATLLGVGFRGRAVLNVGLRGEVLETSVLTFSDFDVAELVRGAGLTGRVGGHLTGEFVAHGPIADPRFTTSLTWHEPVVAGVTAEQWVVAARREADGLTLTGGLERGGRRVLDVTGVLPLESASHPREWFTRARGWAGDPATRIDITALEFPLDWLPILAPRLPLRSDGFVSGAITLRGADAVPWIEGALSIEQGVFSLLSTQTASIGPLDGTIEFEGRSARFDPLRVAATRGRASLAGSVRWSELGIDDVSVETRFDGYRFDQLGLLQTTLDGSVLASGPLKALHLGGEIRLGEVRVSFPNQQNPILKEIRVMGLPETRSASIREGEARVAGIEDRTTADVAIVLPKGTWIRGIGLDAEVFGAVDVTKAAGSPLRYAGQLEVSHGRYSVQGKRFEIDRGVAIFTGGASPIPDLDIEANRRASREVTVYAHLRGPANAPTLELTSDPAMDTAEIVSYLFFGRSATVGNRESTNGLGESAASVAGSMLVDSIAPELRDVLRIDEISVTSNEDDQTPAVEIETQVTPDVYLRIVQSLGGSANETVEIRWRFWRDLSLKSRVNRTGASAIFVLWEFNYWGLERFGLAGFTPPPPPFRAIPVEDRETVPDACVPPLACPAP